MNRYLPPEWAEQDGVLIAWPHEGTDWADMLPLVQACYVEIASAILRDERLLIVCSDEDQVRSQLAGCRLENARFFALPTNDTWTRDYGPITVMNDGEPLMLDFTFNAWGQKFAADCDNQVCRRLHALHAFAAPLSNQLDMVLEGGSIESDGQGTVMTTTRCLLEPNRNPWLSQEQIEHQLKQRLGCEQVLWLDHGALDGDDTDGHIDTLARFAPDGTIVYVGCDDTDDPQYTELRLMEQQLLGFTSAQGRPYRLLRLPSPEAIYEGPLRLPATYANYLVLNHSVLVPVYGQPANDMKALQTLREAFPTRETVAIDCRALICQNGSLHCSTMQFPPKTLAL